ncbi:MAG: acyl-CoA dehydrogenase N-terminal domain-containing protein, partial [Rhodobacteraceae bacterium]|nr:acyl-CoA dehydrogenase N-terminal domain-containing protein [Paracoccaceae bacterium]
MPFRAPVEDFSFLLKHIVGFEAVQGTERFEDATDDVTDAILTEAGKMCEEIIAPVQRNGDLHPARLENGVVRTSPGYAEAFKGIAEGGWIGISASPDHG